MSEVNRLNYIGSKHQLIDWIFGHIQERTGWTNFDSKHIADLFSGTGIVSWNLRIRGASTSSNDSELYSAMVTEAFARSVYNDNIEKTIKSLNSVEDGVDGFVTRNFSPFETCERMFFTVENARRIDWIRGKIEEMRPDLSADEYTFLVASLVVSADAVSNVPAVYGMFLKQFKQKAMKKLVLKPIHTRTLPAEAHVTNTDVLQQQWGPFDATYLDPPYNERQYSKNYFPLNIIAMSPEVAARQTLYGKTGIPQGSFVSPFCQKKKAEQAFDSLFGNITSKWIFLSYNSESLLSKDKMLEIMRRHGEASVIEADYKRFKSFDYNADKPIKEFLFSLQKF
jgi:adenine-specific DNA-methyltransferase